MINKARRFLWGTPLSSNKLGWSLVGTVSGFLVRPPTSGWGRVMPLVPFAGNLLLAAYYYYADVDKCAVAVCVTPASLFIGFLLFREVVVYINTKRHLVMPGCFFPRMAFGEVCFSCTSGDRTSVQLLSDQMNNPLTIWGAETETEARSVCEFLKEQVSFKTDGRLSTSENV